MRQFLPAWQLLRSCASQMVAQKTNSAVLSQYRVACVYGAVDYDSVQRADVCCMGRYCGYGRRFPAYHYNHDFGWDRIRAALSSANLVRFLSDGIVGKLDQRGQKADAAISIRLMC